VRREEKEQKGEEKRSGVWSVESVMLRVESGVQGLECGVWSVK
jgi:hypothetical protein